MGVDRFNPLLASPLNVGIENTDSGILEATLTNKSGAATTEGYVYRIDPDNNESFDYASEDEDAQVVVATSIQIADSSSGMVYVSGVFDVYVNGDTSRGDYLYFSSTSGQAKPLKLLYDGGCIGEAIEARTGAGLVKARVYNKKKKIVSSRRWQIDGHIRIPVGKWSKYASNPILDIGDSGDWDDTFVVPYGGAKWDRATEQWYMMYEGWSASSGHGVQSFGLATSPDLYTWTKHGSNPLFQPAGPGNWDEYIRQFSTIWDDANNEWRMYYIGYDSGNVNIHDIGVATSPDSITWTRYGGNPIIASNKGNWSPSVRKIGNRYFMLLYNGTNAVGEAWESDDGLTSWTKYGSITVSPGQAWSSSYIANYSVYYDQGIFYCMIEGSNGSNQQIGLIASSGHRYNYIADMLNPVLPISASGWDSQNVAGPVITLYNDVYYCYYAGHDGTNYRAGVATIP